MTNPPGPETPEPSAYPPPPAYPAYAAAPPPAPQYSAPPASSPGRTLGIVAFVLAFLMPLLGLILGIVALVQSSRARTKNGLALAAVIIGAILVAIGIIVGIAVIAGLGQAAAELARLCSEYGTGTHEIGGVSVTLDCE